MLRWKTPIKTNDLLVEDFQGNPNKSMLLYIILVVVLAAAYLYEVSKPSVQPAEQLVASHEVDVEIQGAPQE